MDWKKLTDDLLIQETIDLTGKETEKGTCRRDIKKYSFPQRCIEICNRLKEEAVQAKTIKEFQVKLDECI